MKKNRIIIFIWGILLLASIIVFKKLAYLDICLGLWTLILLFRNGLPREKNFYSGYTMRMTIIGAFSYFLLIYILGFVLGFSRNGLNLSLSRVLINISLPLVWIVCEEIIRAVYARKCLYDKTSYIVLCILFIFLNIIMEFDSSYFANFEIAFIYICKKVLPLIMWECLYGYITFKANYRSSLLLKIVINLYVYIFPILPNLGNYVSSVVGVLFPAIMYLALSKTFNENENKKQSLSKFQIGYVLFPLGLVMIALIFLVSGIGPYHMVAIGSGSMEPIYYRGDAIIYDKKFNFEEISIGTVVAYQRGGVLVTHRVIGKEQEDGKYVYITKGDNNETADSLPVNEWDVKGIVKYVVPYIGMPTLWLRELFDSF